MNHIHESHKMWTLPVTTEHEECLHCYHCTCHTPKFLEEPCPGWARHNIPLNVPLLTVDMILAKAYSIPSTDIGWRIYTINLDQFRYQVVAKPLGNDKFEVRSVRGRNIKE
ncbi:hypothetical protein SEA_GANTCHERGOBLIN_51 [Arthrobacter phage GantcherGoblin]|nr:hypothetical protein SEA_GANTCHERGOBLIN_51 [Arthrobacter phage GantcherGoblin]